MQRGLSGKALRDHKLVSESPKSDHREERRTTPTSPAAARRSPESPLSQLSPASTSSATRFSHHAGAPPASIPQQSTTTQRRRSMHCAESLRQLILRAAPSAVNMVGDVLRLAAEQQLSDEEVLRQTAATLGVGLDGWPTDPLARRRLRLERFYQFNPVPFDLHRIEQILNSPQHTERHIIDTLYRKYQRNEIGEALDPDVRLGESLNRVFACAAPSMLSQVQAFVEEREQSGLTHDQYLEEVCRALHVGTDGWPLDPDERLRARLVAFYQRNDSQKMDRVNVLMAKDFSEEEIFSALYERYGKDELGQPVRNESLLREQLVRLLAPTMREKLIPSLLEHKKTHRLTDVELMLAVRRRFALREDGWPIDTVPRLRARARYFLKVNSRAAGEAMQQTPHSSGASPPPFAGPLSFSPKRGKHSSVRTLTSQPPPAVWVAGEEVPFEVPHPPPLLTEQELQDVLASDELVDDLLCSELREVRRRQTSETITLSELSRDDSMSTSAAGDVKRSAASHWLKKAKQRATRLLEVRKALSPLEKQRRAEEEAVRAALQASQAESMRQNPILRAFEPVTEADHFLASTTAEDEAALFAQLCTRFQRNEVGEVVLPSGDRSRILIELLPFVERYVTTVAGVYEAATELSLLNISEEDIWTTARRRFARCDEHTAFTEFRNKLEVILQRCAVEPDATQQAQGKAKATPIMVCMYEDGLTPEDVLATVCRKYRVDEDGWPTDAVARRRTQLQLLFQRHDPKRIKLIDTLYMHVDAPTRGTALPTGGDVDRLYKSLCAEFGADELGRPVVSTPVLDTADARATPFYTNGASPSPSGNGVAAESSEPRSSQDDRSNNRQRRFRDAPPPDDRRLAYEVKLRKQQASDKWGGDTAAADVAVIIGEDYLAELQAKYGADSGSRAHTSPMPRLAAAASSERAQRSDSREVDSSVVNAGAARELLSAPYKFRGARPCEQELSNPIQAHRASVLETLQQLSRSAERAAAGPTRRKVPELLFGAEFDNRAIDIALRDAAVDHALYLPDDSALSTPQRRPHDSGVPSSSGRSRALCHSARLWIDEE